MIPRSPIADLDRATAAIVELGVSDNPLVAFGAHVEQYTVLTELNSERSLFGAVAAQIVVVGSINAFPRNGG